MSNRKDAANSMELGALTEQEQEEIIKQTAREAEQTAYIAELSLLVGVGSEKNVAAMKRQAEAAVRAANQRGVKGPYFTAAERANLHRSNVASIERMWLTAQLKEEAGIEQAEDPAKLAEQHAKLIAVTPPEPNED